MRGGRAARLSRLGAGTPVSCELATLVRIQWNHTVRRFFLGTLSIAASIALIAAATTNFWLGANQDSWRLCKLKPSALASSSSSDNTIKAIAATLTMENRLQKAAKPVLWRREATSTQCCGRRGAADAKLWPGLATRAAQRAADDACVPKPQFCRRGRPRQ